MKKNVQVMCILAALLLSIINANAQKASKRLLTPTNHALVLIDLQGQMVFAVKNIPTEELRNNTAIVAGAAKIFSVPTVVSIIAEKSFSGPVIPEVQEFFPRSTNTYYERTSMNAWEDVNARKAIVDKKKNKIVFGGLWTEVCLVDAVLSAIEEGYDVYFITDISGGVSMEAHEKGVQRMIQAGGQPMTAMQYILELQRDWARTETYEPVTTLIKKYGGAYGVGILYAHEMLKH
jgi:nicotinamidase-related amidase